MNSMTHLTRLPAPDGVAPAAQYTRAVTGTGRLVAVSGRLPLDEDGGIAGEGDAGARARQVLENPGRCPAAAGATFDDVAKPAPFVTDTAHGPAVRAARAEHLPDGRLPAASAVQVAGLVRPEFPLDVEAVAVVDA